MGAISVANSFNTLAERVSGPVAFLVLREDRSFNTPSHVMVRQLIGGKGDLPRSGILELSSWVNTELNWVLKAVALLLLLKMTLLPAFNVDTLVGSCFLEFMNFQKDL